MVTFEVLEVSADQELEWYIQHGFAYRVRCGRAPAFAFFFGVDLPTMGVYVHFRMAAAPVSPWLVCSALRQGVRMALGWEPMALATIKSNNAPVLEIVSRLGFRRLMEYDDGVGDGIWELVGLLRKTGRIFQPVGDCSEKGQAGREGGEFRRFISQN